MTRPELLALFAATAALTLAAPAVAQIDHSKMNMPGMTTPAPAKKPAAKKPAAKKPAAKKPPAKAGPAKKPAVRKPAANKAPAKPAASEPHGGQEMSDMPDMAVTPEVPGGDAPMPAGHDMSTMDPAPGREVAGTDLPAGTAPPPPVPTDRAADRVYGARQMAMGRHHLDKSHGGQKLAYILFNIAEAQFRNGRDGFEWGGEGWYGGDIDRLWVKSEGEGAWSGPVDKAEVQALYSRAIDPYFNLQGGLRFDFKPDPSRVYATIGVEGLAPGFFDVEGALFLSNKGELMARLEGYYDQRLTQRLIAQPLAELNFAAQNSRELGLGAGLSEAEIGLRLRYDIRREFAPYVGVRYRRAFGDTRRFVRQAGDDPQGWDLLTGVRLAF